MFRYDHYESPSSHRASRHTDRHGHSARPSTTGSHRCGNDPLARWNLWDQPQLIDALIIQMYIAENGGNTRFEGGINEVANEWAQFDNGVTGRHMSPRDVIDIYHWLQVNPDHPQNPYSRWERACGAFASGANGDPYDLPVVRGEFSVADVENYLARLILDYTKQKVGPEIARELEECTRRCIHETASGIAEDDHRPHRGPCKLTYFARLGRGRRSRSNLSGTTLVGESSENGDHSGHGVHGGRGRFGRRGGYGSHGSHDRRGSQREHGDHWGHGGNGRHGGGGSSGYAPDTDSELDRMSSWSSDSHH